MTQESAVKLLQRIQSMLSEQGVGEHAIIGFRTGGKGDEFALAWPEDVKAMENVMSNVLVNFILTLSAKENMDPADYAETMLKKFLKIVPAAFRGVK